jgi:exosome complex RNA-binding protein Rrp42 (RNase PH superfamily)
MTDSVALNFPVTFGLQATVILQLAPTARLEPQLTAVFSKELASVPEILPTLDSVTAAVPVFLTVTTWVALVDPTVVDANVSDEGVTVTLPAAAVAPVPDSDTVWGEPAALSVTDNEAVSFPGVEGLNATVIAQFAPTASVVPQVVDFVNELAFVPVIAGALDSVTATFPVFLTVTTWVALVDPTVVDAKVSDTGLTVTAGAGLADGQLFTKLAILIDPRPVARS